MAAISLQACALADIYNMQGMDGMVVDKATKQPIEGVMVVEAWGFGGGFEGHTIGYLPLREAVTDSNGRYAFTARGTEKVSKGFLTEQSPWLIYFKPNYIFISKNNRFLPERRFEYRRRSDWDGKSIELERFEGSPQAWAKELERFSSVLGDLSSNGQCALVAVPHTLWILYQEHNRMLKQGVLAKVAIGALHRRKRLSECPSSEEFNEIFANEVN